MARNREKEKERLDRLRAEGKCITCGDPAEGFTRCAACRERASILQKERYRVGLVRPQNPETVKARTARLVAEGKCVQCMGPINIAGFTRCSGCRNKNKTQAAKKRAERLKAGLCGCGRALSPSSENTTCARCIRNVEVRRQALKAASRCQHCGCEVVDGVSNCGTCILGSVARKYLGARGRASELEALLSSQGGRCVYTGETLVVGAGASLDHIVPKAKGGESDIPNYQWVSYQVNTMKSDMSHDEFIAMCQLIADRSRGIL